MRRLSLLLLMLTAYSANAQPDILQYTVTYYDSIRKRPLVTEVWRPDTGTAGALPLVLFSHGTGGNRMACSWFCAGLAEKGFMAAAVDHYGNTYTNPIPAEFVRFWQRPQDISAVLTQLLADTSFAPYINRNRIYAAGFSIGGYTALALAGAEIDWDQVIRFTQTPQGMREVNVPEMPGLLQLFAQDSTRAAFLQSPPLKDSRIKAVFAMAPAAGQGFAGKAQVKNIKIPVFITAAAADSIAPVKTNAGHYKKILPAARWLLIPAPAGHYVFLNRGTPAMQESAPVFFKDAGGVRRKLIHQQVLTAALGFFKGK